MRRTAFIINPRSARGNYQPFLNALQRKLPDALIHISESIEGTRKFIEEHDDKVDIFVAYGGDGTISSVAKQLVNSDKILAIFPAGSGNGFSNETNFTKNIVELLHKIQRGNFREIDTLMINGHFSINVSGAGFDGAVVKNFEKTSRGFRNYIKTSLQTYFSYQPETFRFSDEHVIHDGEYLMLNVANTRQFGNNAYIAPHASTIDGLAEIVLVRKFPLWYAPYFAWRLFAGKLREDQYIRYISAGELVFTTTTRDWHLDGEYTNITSPVHIKVLPRSLRILQ